MRYLINILFIILSCICLTSCGNSSPKVVVVTDSSYNTESEEIKYSDSTDSSFIQTEEPILDNESSSFSPKPSVKSSVKPSSNPTKKTMTPANKYKITQDYVEDLVIDYVSCYDSKSINKFKSKYEFDNVKALSTKVCTSVVIRSCAEDVEDSSSYIVSFNADYESKTNEYKSGVLLVDFKDSKLVSIEVLDFY